MLCEEFFRNRIIKIGVLYCLSAIASQQICKRHRSGALVCVFCMVSHLVDVGLCKRKRCENGGTCLGNNDGSIYKCLCPSGFIGEGCSMSKLIPYLRNNFR